MSVLAYRTFSFDVDITEKKKKKIAKVNKSTYEL